MEEIDEPTDEPVENAPEDGEAANTTMEEIAEPTDDGWLTRSRQKTLLPHNSVKKTTKCHTNL
jgi:hypothetical protein